MESQPQNPADPADQNRVAPAAGSVRKEQPAPRLLEQVRNVLRLHHYSIHTERSYLDWIKRYIRFHHMRSREDLAGGEAKIEAFCTDLAANGKVVGANRS